MPRVTGNITADSADQKKDNEEYSENFIPTNWKT